MMIDRRRTLLVIGLAGCIVGWLWLWRLPTEEVCSRTGRIVDPTHRHCVALDGSYVQLREHMEGHATEAVWLLLLIGSAVFLLHCYQSATRASSR
ncbi:MAG: hypothetical protein ACREUQ_08725 [Burkholderiales bacterium]